MYLLDGFGWYKIYDGLIMFKIGVILKNVSAFSLSVEAVSRIGL